MTPTLRFYFDYISPYAYLAWQWVGDMCAEHGVELEPIPVLFAGLLGHWGHLGPAEIPPKRAFVFRDAYRIASLNDVPIALPDTHPFNPLVALRVSTLEVAGEQQQEVIEALWQHIWGKGISPSSPQIVAEALDKAGLDGKSLVAKTSSPEVKQALKDNTASFIEEGGFGVPGFLYEGELFWGNNQRPYIERWLKGERGYDPELLDTLIAQKFGVRRKRPDDTE